MKVPDVTESIVKFMCDESSIGSGINIIELHACYRASVIVLTAEIGNPPTPNQVIQFSTVAALCNLKNAVLR